MTKTYDVRTLLVKGGAQLIATITKTVTPELWQSAGGKYSIAEVNGQLVITASNRAHSQIAELLKQLAASK